MFAVGRCLVPRQLPISPLDCSVNNLRNPTLVDRSSGAVPGTSLPTTMITTTNRTKRTRSESVLAIIGSYALLPFAVVCYLARGVVMFTTRTIDSPRPAPAHAHTAPRGIDYSAFIVSLYVSLCSSVSALSLSLSLSLYIYIYIYNMCVVQVLAEQYEPPGTHRLRSGRQGQQRCKRQRVEGESRPHDRYPPHPVTTSGSGRVYSWNRAQPRVDVVNIR